MLQTQDVGQAIVAVMSKEEARSRPWGGPKQRTGRRRLVDPTTTERLYSEQEWEFIRAMEVYKLKSCRMFPTWSEALEVLISLGYHKELVLPSAASPAA